MRKIIHIDMDAFFASVEQVNNPKYKNKPLIVGHGIVTTCSYEARQLGIHSTMPVKEALKLCPNAIVVTPNKKLYSYYSNIIKKIFLKYTSEVEPASIDEAYLDVTKNNLNMTSATLLAKIIQKDVQDTTSLTCSCGVSYNKFLAKSASDINKPNGVYTITPDNAEEFLNNLSIYKFHKIGKKTANKMISMGIYNGKDLRSLNIEILNKTFKNQGEYYYNIARGLDNSKIITNRPLHSISKEKTLSFNEYIITHKELLIKLIEIFSITYNILLSKKYLYPKTITIKIKYEDFKSTTKSKSLTFHTANYTILLNHLKEMIKEIELRQKVRLYGIAFSNFSTIDQTNSFNKNIQQKLF